MLVAEIEEPLVLGNDFLFENGCTIDIGHRVINLSGKTIPCYLEDELPSIFRIRLSTDLVVLPSCEMILPDYIQSNETTILPKQMILEGTERFMENKEIVVARVLVDDQSEIIPVHVFNPQEKEVKIFKETILRVRHQVLGDTEGKSYTARTDILDAFICKHLTMIIDECQEWLNEEQMRDVIRLMSDLSDIFSKSKDDLGHTDIEEHQINTGDARPKKQESYPFPLSKRQAERSEVQQMLENIVIEPSSSSWGSPIVMVAKKWFHKVLCRVQET